MSTANDEILPMPLLTSSNKQLYYRLIALWAVCEGVLGGIIHGLKLPVSGLVVGSSAVIIVCLIGYYVPSRGSILKATLIVAIFKMMLSPQSPLPAYFAVFFQGITGEIFFGSRKYYKVSCIVFATLALFESGVQRIVVMTLVYGTEFWKAVNIFISGLTHEPTVTNYSLYFASGYILLHIIVGVIIGRLASVIPQKVKGWSEGIKMLPLMEEREKAAAPEKKKSSFKTWLLIGWLVLLLLFLQSEFKIGYPLLPSNLVLHILLRSIIILLTWYFFLSPVLTWLLKKWLEKKQVKMQNTISEIIVLLPATKQLVEKSWQYSAEEKGIKRLNKFLKTVLAVSLSRNHEE